MIKVQIACLVAFKDSESTHKQKKQWHCRKKRSCVSDQNLAATKHVGLVGLKSYRV